MFKHGVKDCLFIHNFKDGSVNHEIPYKNGKVDDIVIEWREDGLWKKETIYKDDRIISLFA